MKFLRKILVLTIIALIVQHGILLYVEKIYMSTDLNIEIKKSDEKETLVEDKSEIEIKNGLENVYVSSNGRFVSYLENNKIKIFDSNDNSEKELKSGNQGEIVFYKWLTNADNIIVIQKIRENGNYYFEPIVFNAKSAEALEFSDFNLNKIKIKLENKEDKVDKVAFSTVSQSLYIKIKKKNNRCDLYYGNVMNEFKKSRSNKLIGNIGVPTTGANAIMEMGSNVTILNSSDNITIPNAKNPKILGTDITDNVYFGSEVNGKIEKICYAVASDNYKEWKEIKLNKPVDKEDIIVDYSGKVYVNDKTTSSALELISNKSINYKGELIQSYSNGIISRSGNKLIKIKI